MFSDSDSAFAESIRRIRGSSPFQEDTDSLLLPTPSYLPEPDLSPFFTSILRILSRATSQEPKMPPLLTCIRHAQGYHNLAPENEEKYHDPDLTPRGTEQCKRLAKTFPHHSSVDKILASPLRRTIQTALTSLSPCIQEKHLPILLMPKAQETSAKPSDTGSNISKLETEYGSRIDCSRLAKFEGEWLSNSGEWEMISSKVDKHAYEIRRYIKDLDAKHVVLVTHGGFLHWLTEDWSDNPGEENATGWTNTEYRTYEFIEGPGAHMKEVEESRERRRKGGAEANSGFRQANGEQDELKDEEERLNV